MKTKSFLLFFTCMGLAMILAMPLIVHAQECNGGGEARDIARADGGHSPAGG